MKRLFFVLSVTIFLCNIVKAEELFNKEVSKKDWEQYQEYKKQRSESIKVSEEEYKQYQEYLKKRLQDIDENSKTNYQNQPSQTYTSQVNINKSKIFTPLENEFIIKAGKTITGKSKVNLKNSYNGASLSGDDTSSDGYVIKFDYIHYYFQGLTGFGCGGTFNSFDEDKVIDIYALFKQRFPFTDYYDKENIYFYLSAGVGYSFFVNNTKNVIPDTIYYLEYKGKMYYIISAGIDIDSFIFEISYSSNCIDITSNHPYITGDGTYNAVNFSVGYKFKY